MNLNTYDVKNLRHLHLEKYLIAPTSILQKLSKFSPIAGRTFATKLMQKYRSYVLSETWKYVRRKFSTNEKFYLVSNDEFQMPFLLVTSDQYFSIFINGKS